MRSAWRTSGGNAAVNAGSEVTPLAVTRTYTAGSVSGINGPIAPLIVTYESRFGPFSTPRPRHVNNVDRFILVVLIGAKDNFPCSLAQRVGEEVEGKLPVDDFDPTANDRAAPPLSVDPVPRRCVRCLADGGSCKTLSPPRGSEST